MGLFGIFIMALVLVALGCANEALGKIFGIILMLVFFVGVLGLVTVVFWPVSFPFVALFVIGTLYKAFC